MQLVRRLRLPALFCSLAVLLCEIISHPNAEMGIADDRSFIHSAQQLAATGHILYNGWATPILGWQLYVAAPFIKLFGFSLTTVRMSTLLVAMALAFLLQRTLVLVGITERNATLGTLAFVVSPLYLMLSVTFMTDITGLFGIAICLYSCLRALQAPTTRATIAWIFFAVLSNAICGSSRQISWLGILVMVPSALWLLRSRRSVLLAGAAATLAGAVFILACIVWFKHQPYSIPEHLLPPTFPIVHTVLAFTYTLLDLPFLLLPIVLIFLPQLRRSRPRTLALFAIVLCGYMFVALYPSHLRGGFPLEPTAQDHFGLNQHGAFDFTCLPGDQPVFLNRAVWAIFTFASIGGLLAVVISLLQSHNSTPLEQPSTGVTWNQLRILLGPFTLVYILLLVPRAATVEIFERYTLALLVVALVCLVRFYQERIHPRLPIVMALVIALMAALGIAVTHNTFALYRARIALAAELNADGVPSTSVNNGWEYNFGIELQHAGYINDSRIVRPANAYVAVPPPPPGPCTMFFFEKTPDIHPLYSVSFEPDTCYGPAPFAPVHYSRWPYRTPGTLYVVRSTPPSSR